MKKFGKYEKMRKNAIMKTYVTSLLCLVLCVSMFFGTSFAWFTSEVNNTNNEIYIGTLDVDLFKDNGLDSERKTIWADLASSDVKLFNGNIRWEPGYTTLETIKIVNKGDLAFNYVLNFTDGTITKTGETEPATTVELKDVAKFFDVWVYDHTGKDVPNPSSYGGISEANGWTPVGSLDKLLAGDAVLSGTMEDKNVRYPQSTEPSAAAEGAESSTKPAINDKTTDGKPSEVTYTIALHMKEEATAEVMGFKLSLNVKLIAYQMASEQDDLNSKYDQMVATEEELKEAIANGGNVVLADDIKLDATVTIPENVTATLDLNGHKIEATLADSETTETQLFYVSKGATLTINGAGDSQIHVQAGKSNSKVSAVINNCGGTVVINGGSYTMRYGTHNEGYLIPTLVDNNSTLGESRLIINGGTFKHTRNMFRNFANNSSQTATITINGGIFKGEASDPGQIWNQKPSANTPTQAGKIELNGGAFEYMQICDGFGAGTNVVVKEGVGITIENWEESDSEWTGTITSNSGNN